MCGIAGIWQRDGDRASGDALGRMLGAMRHRGPEGTAHARMDRGSVLLGFLALGFTDDPTSLQPLFNEDHTLALVYNGEIYDYEALRVELIARGHRFRTQSDSEVIIHLYEEYGDRFVEHLNGEFAFVLWDERRRELVMVRDRFGVKPLFVAEHRGAVVFASEMKALLALTGFDRAMEPRWFAGPGVGVADTAVTAFRGIRSVRPGHLERVRVGGSTASMYWRPQFRRDRTWAPGEAEEAVREVVTRAVTRRVSGDVPLALALSSGLDSTIVAALTAQLRPDRTAFTASFPEAPYDESAEAGRNARKLGLDVHPVVCTAESLAEGFLDSLWSIEVPINNTTTPSRIAMTKAVRAAGFKAIVGGEAADEVFAGYPYFALEAIWRDQSSDDRATREAADRAWRQFQRDNTKSDGVFWTRDAPWRTTVPMLGYPSMYHLRAIEAEGAMKRLLSRDMLARVGTERPLDTLHRELDPSYLRTLHPLDATRVISRSILGTFNVPVLGDRVEMAASLEGRVPFLDRDVVELAYSLAPDLCVEPGTYTTKAVLRRAFDPMLPAGRLPPRKHTWMAPSFADLAATEPGAALFDQFLSREAVRDVGMLNPRSVLALRAAWKVVPRWSRKFRMVDGMLGYLMSLQAMHHVFVSEPRSFGHQGAFDLGRDQSPPSEEAS